MKRNIGIIRSFDSLGRMVVPIEYRRTLGIDERTPCEITCEDDTIVIKKYREACAFCGSYEDLLMAGGVKVCRSCAKSIIGLMGDKP